MIQTKLPLSLVAAALLTATAAPSQAALTTYGGTSVGDVVRFVLDPGTTGAFGAPQYQQIGTPGESSGSSLSFKPGIFGFDAEAGLGSKTDYAKSGYGGSVDRARAGFDVRIEAARGYEITNIAWNEDGAYSAQGSGAKVSANAFLRATDATTGGPLFRDAQSVTYNGDNAGNWDLSSYKSVASGTGAVDLRLKDIITASAAKPGDWAWIEKDFGDLRVTVEQKPGSNPGGFPAAVPLPASLWLLGSALASIVTIGRRRSASLAA